MKKIFLLGFILLLITNLFSQQTTSNLLDLGIFSGALPGGKVTITQDQRLQTIVNNHILANKERPLKGYRVQIYFGTGSNAKAKAEGVKKDFLLKHTDIEAYMVYDSPYFKVRVGNFRSKLDAEKFKIEIQGEYENIFLIEEEIQFPDL